MRLRIPYSLLLALGLALCFTGCRGSMEIATLDDGAPDDDDGASDDDDGASDDDDGAPDDDDGAPDDDDVVPPEGILGYFYLQGTVQHPQGRFADGFGYYFIQEGRSIPELPAPPLADPSLARGQDYGCEIDLPDADGEHRDEVVTLDAGLWSQLSTINDSGDLWIHTMERTEDDGSIYYVSAQSGNPPAVPPGVLLDFEVPGGAGLPAISMSQAFPTHAPFSLSEPVLDPAEDLLVVDREEGLAFRWDPEGEEGVEIVLAFFDQDLIWSLNCWVEDVGAFDLNAGLVEGMPSDLTGLTWFRRYVTAWHPNNDEHPDTVFTGALQHRWFVQMTPEGDPEGEG